MRPLKSDTMPRRQMYMDMEAISRTEGDTEYQRFRCGSLLVVDYRTSNGHRPRESLETYDKARHIAEAIDREARSGETIPVWAHHIDYDLWIAELIQNLERLRWHITRHIAAGRIYAIGMARGNKRLMFCNSYPLVNMTMERVANIWKIAYQPLPPPMARHLRWRKRSRQDVRLLRLAIEHIQHWWADNNLGPWRVTPAALGWSAYRRQFLDYRLLVNHEPEYNKIERDAYITGRADIDRHGELPKDDYTILDINECYGSILTHAKLPRRPLGHGHGMSMENYLRWRRSFGFIAECEVTTDVDCVPCRGPNGVCYPVGPFTATLCSPEIDLVLEHGGTVKFLHYAVYAMAPITRKFGLWREAQLQAAVDREDWLIAALLKQWGRTTVGKFGQRGDHWKDMGGALHPEQVKIIRYRDPEQNYFTNYLNAGGRMFKQEKGGNGENAMPAVAAWVCSLARIQLWRHIQKAGRDNVIYIDTDSLHVTPEGRANLADDIGDGPGQLHIEHEYQTGEISLPKVATFGTKSVLKGAARPRRRLAAGTYEVIESGGFITWATKSKPGVVTRQRGTMNYHKPYDRKWCLANGRCVPLVMDIIDGMTYVVPWSIARKRYGNLKLKDPLQDTRVARAP